MVGPDTLVVAVAGSEPFVIRREGKPVRGISIDIWERVANHQNYVYRYQQFPSVGAAIDAASMGVVDVAVGPFTITEERCKLAHFTQPYFTSTIGILTRDDALSVWGIVQPFMDTTFLIGVISLIVVLFIVGNLIWWFERKEEEHLPQKYIQGIASGMWFAIVTFTTVGYGDIAPKTGAGRFLSAIWMIVAMVTASSLTAGIATAFTLFSLRQPEIDTPADLDGKRVAVLEGSTGERFARRYGARLVPVPSIAEAGAMLSDKSVVAITHDFSVLSYYSHQHHSLNLQLLHSGKLHEYYGFCTPLDDERNHAISLSLLRMLEDGSMRQILDDWNL